jgi:hypothetical protein
VEIGQRLHKVKALLPHGKFGHWLTAEFQWSIATAENLMGVTSLAEQNRKFYEYEHCFARSALYLLAAPSTPEAAQLNHTFAIWLSECMVFKGRCHLEHQFSWYLSRVVCRRV